MEHSIANPQVEEEKQQQMVAVLPFGSLSLSLSSAIAPHFTFTKPAATSHLSPPTASFKLSFSTPNLSIRSSLSSSAFFNPSPSPLRRNSGLRSAFSSSTIASPLRHLPGNSDNSPGGAYGRRNTIVWFRNDLRVHDNEALSSADSESLSLLPVFVFDAAEHGKPAAGTDRNASARAAFLIQAVADLRQSLKKRGSDLVVRVGKPEKVLVELARNAGADSVFAHREAINGEVKAEAAVEAALSEEGVETKWFWGSTLFHLDDLPFKLEQMPANFGGFREKVKKMKVRNTIEAADKLKGFPATNEEIEPGRIPTLSDLGLSPLAAQGGKSAAVGGETEGLQKLKKLAAECQAQSSGKNASKNNIYGANLSCKISPWLATGCISPRQMFNEIKKSAMSSVSAAMKNGDWLMNELIERDFFRFVTRKYSAAKTLTAAPATACAGAIA
ncbi:blue-light photoreceptor PHR2-like [Nymphaea colorata]|nr:blue-light photoreceptor PHR2-like [Nymphaea colorata]